MVACGSCGGLLTAAWSKGRSKRYPYDVCLARYCAGKGKSVRKEKVEGEFEALLRQLTPVPELFTIAKAMLRDLWDARLGQADRGAAQIEKEIAAIEAKTGQLVERLIETDSPTLIAAHEAQIVKLEEQKMALADRGASSGQPRMTFEAVSRTALTFLANPWKI
ncbi:hypothetical protein LNKW23_22430 [Paralimibaculum aggregatum]|uniref:Recombinase zinc beta ribbon domain-containing protein n=1 Tax=Paralimibaculum aggregatum TaxID=3036245 RepID=A0ABQ6LL85_9RHOB|nr:zinc ribbon domain-containing protein [Limibaculum sp. NKW23]GMG83030.1 hypothetical protein LNKW23_22430 [Limibaculum sp. NKW23]